MKGVRVSPGPQGLGNPLAPRGKQGHPGTCRGVAADTGHRSVGLTRPQEGGAGRTPPPNQEPRGVGSPTAPRSPQRRLESLELAAWPQASHWAVFTYSLKYPSPYNLNQATGCYYKSNVCPWQTSKCSRRAENRKQKPRCAQSKTSGT